MLQLDAFVNRRTKQKTVNTVTFSHFYQYELDISVQSITQSVLTLLSCCGVLCH